MPRTVEFDYLPGDWVTIKGNRDMVADPARGVVIQSVVDLGGGYAYLVRWFDMGRMHQETFGAYQLDPAHPPAEKDDD